MESCRVRWPPAHNTQNSNNFLFSLIPIECWPNCRIQWKREGELWEKEKKKRQSLPFNSLLPFNQASLHWMKGRLSWWTCRAAGLLGAPFRSFIPLRCSLFLLNEFNKEEEIAFTSFILFILKPIFFKETKEGLLSLLCSLLLAEPLAASRP